MKIKLLSFATIILSLSILVNGQEIENTETSEISLPENVMREVVQRILVYKFKPVKRKKIVYLSQKGIEPTWLPKIKNIEFSLLSNEEIDNRDSGIYFFSAPESKNKTYEIYFAFGNPTCEFIGDSWRFRIINNKVKLWYESEIGGGCSGRSHGISIKPEELNTYPNELKGYKLFNKGKLQGLKLTISTRNDVKKNFGENCDSLCDLDEKWRVYFRYFDNTSFEKEVNNVKTKMVSKEEYIGKLYSITLKPKAAILFDKVVFPTSFDKSNGFSASHDGMGGGTNSSYFEYEDRYGLEYFGA